MKKLTITAAQLGLFLGCLIHVTEAFLDQVRAEFYYEPGYDTQTPFILAGVSQTSFTIKTDFNGLAIAKIFTLDEYGEMALLQLTPAGNYDMAQHLAALDKGLGEYDQVGVAFTADTINMLSDSLNLVTAASQGIDIFHWINADLAQPRASEQQRNELAYQEITQALENPNDFTTI